MVDVDLRGTMRNYATGVCIATTYSENREARQHDALTVNSVMPISADPPLVSVCFRLDSTFLEDLLTTRVWALSILDSDGGDLAKSFAKSRDNRRVTLRQLPTVTGQHTGALILDSFGWLECSVRDHMDVGDHTVVIGEVLAGEGYQHRRPLIFLHGKFRSLEHA